uniref:Putative amblyomma 40-33 family member n=1 Tax=Rhipicephalus pulchellus TaxID=72859 RepID=L7MBM3_RHIPC
MSDSVERKFSPRVITRNIFTVAMLTFCLLVLATVSHVSSSRVSDANAFVDTIFREHVPPRVRESRRLYPYATIGDFSFKVHKNRFTDRDLTVNMMHGEVRGLDTALQRRGDCRAPFFRGGLSVVVCNLTMQGLNITFTSMANRDPRIDSWKTIWVNVNVTDSIVHLEAKAPAGGGHGDLRAFVIKDMRLDVTYDSELSLNTGISEKFKEEISAKVKEGLRPIFSEYMSIVGRAVRYAHVP